LNEGFGLWRVEFRWRRWKEEGKKVEGNERRGKKVVSTHSLPTSLGMHPSLS
jgi:hypothetical protein